MRVLSRAQAHRTSLIVLAVSVVAGCLFVVGCGGGASAGQATRSTSTEASLPGFLQVDSGAALFVRWRRSANRITGVLLVSDKEGTPETQLPFTGSISGAHITLRFGRTFPTPETMTGTIAGSTLHLAYSEDIGIGGTFTAATPDDYRTAATRLREASEPSPKAPGDAALDDALITNIRLLQVALQEFADKHDDTYPKYLTPAAMSGLVARWPKNPFTGRPMTPGTGAGDFAYSPRKGYFTLIGYGRHGQVLVTAP